MRADDAVHALQDRAAALGADVRFGTGRAALRTTPRGVEVDVAGETITAPVAVVTAGAWVRDVVGDALAPDVKVTQEQIQHFAPRVEGEWPSFIHHGQPWVYGLLAPGEGVKVAEHHVGPEVDPDRRPPRDAAAEAKVVGYVEHWFPGLDPNPVHVAECLYTTTPTSRSSSNAGDLSSSAHRAAATASSSPPSSAAASPTSPPPTEPP